MSKLTELITHDPNKLENAEQFLHESSIPDDNEQATYLYNLAFKNCQDFAANIAHRLCPEGILRHSGVRTTLEFLLILRQAAHITLQVPRLPPVDASVQLPPVPLRVPRIPAHMQNSAGWRASAAPHHSSRSHAARGHGASHGGAHGGGGVATSGWFQAVLVQQAQ